MALVRPVAKVVRFSQSSDSLGTLNAKHFAIGESHSAISFNNRTRPKNITSQEKLKSPTSADRGLSSASIKIV